MHAALRAAFKTGRTKSIEFRREQLAQLSWMIKDNQDRFNAAFKSDLGRPEIESNMCVPPFGAVSDDADTLGRVVRLDTGACFMEAKNAYENVAKWAKPEKACVNLVSQQYACVDLAQTVRLQLVRDEAHDPQRAQGRRAHHQPLQLPHAPRPRTHGAHWLRSRTVRGTDADM